LNSTIDELAHPELELWRANVGAPLVLDLAPPLAAPPSVIHVLSWNLAIGAARLTEVIERWFDGKLGDPVHLSETKDIGNARPPLIVLAQEAYRTDESVPGKPSRRHRGKPLHPRNPENITEVAQRFGLSLRYAPSMRNGEHQSDRGNAILATVGLAESHAFALPYVHQRRVVVTAELQNVPALWFTSAHLDLRGQPNGGLFGRYGYGRATQAIALSERLVDIADQACHVLGADLNTPFGGNDPVVTALHARGFADAHRLRRWRHTLHTPVPLAPDHVLFRSPANRIHAAVTRIDAHPNDRGPRVYGSDHHPLLARIELHS
jgi:endonuclease/exonuclease/phosphatase family metal-dependent hydrolase